MNDLEAPLGKATGNNGKRTPRLIIHATNVHQGGGRVLLDEILKLDFDQDVVLFVDARMPLPQTLGSRLVIEQVPRTIRSRLLAEWQLRSMSAVDDVILSFGNLPPLFPAAGRVVVFLQNRFLVDPAPLDDFSHGARLRIMLERLWFRWRAPSVSSYIVQTLSIKKLLETQLKARHLQSLPSVTLLPFIGGQSQVVQRKADPDSTGVHDYDFVYVASGDPHKNHRRLVEAWVHLAKSGSRPSLALTIEPKLYPGICEWLEAQKQAFGLRIENLGTLGSSQVHALYKRSGALIYPSTLESLGLPLIEARSAGLPVLAGELDYVRDVLDPAETFDPGSATSIARAVRRYIKAEEPALKVSSARDFIDAVNMTEG